MCLKERGVCIQVKLTKGETRKVGTHNKKVVIFTQTSSNDFNDTFTYFKDEKNQTLTIISH